MDFKQSFWMNVRQSASRVGLICMPVFLLACAATPAQPQAQAATSDADAAISERQPRPSLPLTPELTYYILAAEIAGQRGQLGVAVDSYHLASELVESPALASRSAQVATFTRDQARIKRALDRWIEVDPDDPDVYIMQAPILMLNGDYDGVVDAVDRALSLAPDRAESYLNSITEHLGEIAEAEQALSTLQRLALYGDNHPAARFAYARMAAYHKLYDEALDALDPLLASYPDNEDYLVLKAEILQRLDRQDEGIRLVAKAAKKADASEQLRFTYGKLLGDSGQSDKAREVFEALHVDNPENRDVLFALGLLALEQRNGQEARAHFSQLMKLGDPSNQSAYFMGLAEEMNGNIDAALVWFASVPMHSHRFDAAQTKYITLLAGRGEIDKVRAHLKMLRQEQPHQALQYYLFEAAFLREQGMNAAAFELYTEALAQYPLDEELLYSRAMVAESLDRLDVLEADLRSILERDPENSAALNALGYTLTDRTDRHEEALQLINKALAIKPGDPFYLDSLGWVYYRLGDLEKAEKYLREAIAIQEDAEFVAHLGEVLWERGKREEAIEVWRKGMEQHGDNELLLDTLRRYGQ